MGGKKKWEKVWVKKKVGVKKNVIKKFKKWGKIKNIRGIKLKKIVNTDLLFINY